LPMRPLHAQGLDQRLADEVNAIRAEVARSNLALRGYTWIEHTEVLVKGKLESVRDAGCRYDATGQIVKTLLAINEDQDRGNGVSNRPTVRKTADQQDYIERAI